MMSGRIRLGCFHCFRDDFDGVDKLPDDWDAVDEVQSYEESIREIDPDDPDGDVTFWETHIGVCRECQQLQRRQAALRSTPAQSASEESA